MYKTELSVLEVVVVCRKTNIVTWKVVPSLHHNKLIEVHMKARIYVVYF